MRALDANRNRALEALRVVEDCARFARGDAAAAAALKGLRHALHGALQDPALGGALAARDVAGDPGRPGAPGAPAEAPRGDLTQVLGANLARAKEALRALEELAKPWAPQAAAAVSRVRYAVYELEPRLLLRPALAGRPVYLILQGGQGRHGVIDQARAALAGGVRLFQLREKGLPDRALLDLARRLHELLEAEGAWLIVNDRPDVARLAGARGVHLGQDDLPPAEARRIVGVRSLVVASAHDPAELAGALAAGVDYVGFGTLYGSATKPSLQPQGLDLLRTLAPGCPVPIYGIGGITPERAAEVIAAGAAGVAVGSAVLDAADPAAAAARLVESVTAALAARGGPA